MDPADQMRSEMGALTPNQRLLWPIRREAFRWPTVLDHLRSVLAFVRPPTREPLAGWPFIHLHRQATESARARERVRERETTTTTDQGGVQRACVGLRGACGGDQETRGLRDGPKATQLALAEGQ